MVQVLVHIRPADRPARKHFELIECDTSTLVRDLKEEIYAIGSRSGDYNLPAESQELVFMDERCLDTKCLEDYGINNAMIKQVAGFVVNPTRPGKVFKSGILVNAE